MKRTCQYCSQPIEGWRMTLSIHDIGGEAVSGDSRYRPAGIISVYRHHPVAVCKYHYFNLPRHVRHCSTERGAWT